MSAAEITQSAPTACVPALSPAAASLFEVLAACEL